MSPLRRRTGKALLYIGGFGLAFALAGAAGLGHHFGFAAMVCFSAAIPFALVALAGMKLLRV